MGSFVPKFESKPLNYYSTLATDRVRRKFLTQSCQVRNNAIRWEYLDQLTRMSF